MNRFTSVGWVIGHMCLASGTEQWPARGSASSRSLTMVRDGPGECVAHRISVGMSMRAYAASDVGSSIKLQKMMCNMVRQPGELRLPTVRQIC